MTDVSVAHRCGKFHFECHELAVISFEHQINFTIAIASAEVPNGSLRCLRKNAN